QFVVRAIVPVGSAQRVQDLFGGAGPQPRFEALRVDEPLSGAHWPVGRKHPGATPQPHRLLRDAELRRHSAHLQVAHRSLLSVKTSTTTRIAKIANGRKRGDSTS